MSHIDDLFREGLGGRNADLPNTTDLWARINAAKQQPLPEGEALDKVFRDELQDRVAPVPAGMWARIVAARTRSPLTKWAMAAAALLLLLLVIGGNLLRNTAISAPAVPAKNEVREQPQPLVIPETDAVASLKATESEFTINTAAAETARATVPAVSAVTARSGDNIPPAELSTEAPATVAEVMPPATAATTPPPAARNLSAAQAISRLPAPLATINPPVNPLPTTAVIPDEKFRASSSSGLQTELLFGIAYSRQEFSLQDPAAAQLRDVRQASEFPEFGYQITLRSTYRFNDRLRILGGLTYAEIRNELEYERFANGSPTLIRTNNNIRMLEAPILLGYSVPGRRVNVTINAGPVVNLATSVRGRFLHPDFGQPLDLTTDGNYRNNVGVGFMTSLSTTYQIGKKHPLTLLVEPYFKAYPTAFTVKDAPLREKYWVAGIQLGVRKTLR